MAATILLCAGCRDSCSELSVKDCADSDSCSLIRGSRLDTDRACTENSESLGCAESDRLCDLAISYARHGDGDIYRFTSSCQPDGWTDVELDVSAMFGVNDIPKCDAK